MASADKSNISTWPHTPAGGAKVPAGTTSPKAGWLGNLQQLKEYINDLLGRFRVTGGHTHTGVDGDGPQIPTGGIAASAVTSAKVDSTVTTNAFKTVTAGGTNVVADSAADTLTFVVSGSGGLAISANASTDTVTLTDDGPTTENVRVARMRAMFL